jgi:hypothetical protein
VSELPAPDEKRAFFIAQTNGSPMPEKQEIEERNNRWHLDKRVSVGHLITTIAMISAAALWLLRLEGRIDLVDLRDTQMNKRIEQVATDRALRDAEIIRKLERIQDTLAEHERNTPRMHPRVD